MDQTVTLSIMIWHSPFHAGRRVWLQRILKRLREIDDAVKDRVRIDVSPDLARSGGWPSWRAAARKSLLSAPTSHHLILADDMLPCHGFITQALDAIAVHPEHPICFFSMRKSQREAREAQANWIKSPDGLWGGAFVTSTEFLKAFMEWERQTVPASYPWEDRRVVLYTMLNKIPIYQTAPSLVQHVDPGTSLLGHPNKNRVAGWYEDYLEPIDWEHGEEVSEKGSLSFKPLHRELLGREP